MIPARRAAASTSPFGNPPSPISASVSALIATRPRAVASRRVTSLSETSTIREWPRSSRWDKAPVVARRRLSHRQPPMYDISMRGSSSVSAERISE